MTAEWYCTETHGQIHLNSQLLLVGPVRSDRSLKSERKGQKVLALSIPGRRTHNRIRCLRLEASAEVE